MGDATMKLFSSFVETSVARQEAPRRSRQPQPSISHLSLPPPPAAALHAQALHPRAPTPAPQQWKVTEDMMNMKWGAVLRTLQPSTANSAPSAPHVTIRSSQHPTLHIGKEQQQYLTTPRPQQNLGYLSARPTLQ